MSRDRREEILIQLEAVLLEEIGEGRVHRDRSDLDRMERPCVIMLDGVESSTGTLTRKSARGPDIRADIMELRPEVFLFLKRREEAQAATRGPELSAYRMQLIKAVIQDETLISIVGSNGGIFYRGHDTDMQSGEAVQGMMLLRFAFHYVLDPNELS